MDSTQHSIPRFNKEVTRSGQAILNIMETRKEIKENHGIVTRVATFCLTSQPLAATKTDGAGGGEVPGIKP